MTKFNFVDPDIMQPRGSKNSLLQEFAEALKARPGEPAEWPMPINPQTARSVSSRISMHDSTAPKLFREGYQAVIRDGVMYVRYIG
jgi:hypothetical protein